MRVEDLPSTSRKSPEKAVVNGEAMNDRIPKIVEVIPKVGELPKIASGNEKTQIEESPYDSKTLKPQAKEWECHLCTLLNPSTSNVCAVCATVRQKQTPNKTAPNQNNKETYLQLVDLDSADLVENVEVFECLVCFGEIPPGKGATLRECLHQFCKICLAHTVEFTEDAEVKCPYRDAQYSCNIALQDREIKALVSPVLYEQYLAKSVSEAENKMSKSFHCKTPDCKGWCVFEDNVNLFRCPVCKKINCLTCQVFRLFGLNWLFTLNNAQIILNLNY